MGDGSRQNHRGGPRRFSSGASAASTVFGREMLLSMQLQPSFSACLTPVRALILLFVLAAFPIGTIAGTLVWTNTAGGAWTNAANWSPNQVPGPADTAMLTSAAHRHHHCQRLGFADPRWPRRDSHDPAHRRYAYPRQRQPHRRRRQPDVEWRNAGRRVDRGKQWVLHPRGRRVEDLARGCDQPGNDPFRGHS